MRLWLSWAAFLVAIGLADLTSPVPATAVVAYDHLILVLAGAFIWAGAFGWRSAAAILLASSVAIAGIAVWQLGYMARARGVFRSPTELAGFAVLCIFLALAFAPRRGWVTFALVYANGMSLALSQSRGAVLALLAGLLCVIPRRWRWAYLGLPLVLAALYWSPALSELGMRDSMGPRLSLWLAAGKIALARPLTGWGQDAVLFWPVRGFYNVAADWLVAGGILGLAAFLWAAVCTLRAARGPLRGLLVAYLANGMLTYDSAATVMPLLVALAAVALEQRRVEDVAAVVDHGEPLLDRGVGADRADR